MTKLVLLTGGTGFAGAAVVDRIVADTDWKIISIERLPKDGVKDRLADVPAHRLERVYHDFLSELPDWLIEKAQGVNYIIHAGGEVQAIRSLDDPEKFVRANVIGTFNMLEAARKIRPEKFLYTSSGEVFGYTPPGVSYKETDSLKPSNPYAASKAAAEMLVHSYQRSFGLFTIITRTMNLFGRRRNAETFVPAAIRKALLDEFVTIHVGPNGKQGTRQWLDVDVYTDALLFLLRNGEARTYHIVGEEKTNSEIVGRIASALEKAVIVNAIDVSMHHPAHDLRYSMDGSLLRSLGWNPSVTFEESFDEMVRWTVDHPEWLE